MTDVVSDTNTGEAIVFWVCDPRGPGGAGMVVSPGGAQRAVIALTMINFAILYVANSAPFSAWSGHRLRAPS